MFPDLYTAQIATSSMIPGFSEGIRQSKCLQRGSAESRSQFACAELCQDVCAADHLPKRLYRAMTTTMIRPMAASGFQEISRLVSEPPDFKRAVRFVVG